MYDTAAAKLFCQEGINSGCFNIHYLVIDNITCGYKILNIEKR